METKSPYLCIDSNLSVIKNNDHVLKHHNNSKVNELYEYKYLYLLPCQLNGRMLSWLRDFGHQLSSIICTATQVWREPNQEVSGAPGKDSGTVHINLNAYEYRYSLARSGFRACLPREGAPCSRWRAKVATVGS